MNAPSAGSALGRPIAGASTAASGTTSPARSASPAPLAASAGTTQAAESIHLPPPPTARAPRSRAILAVATGFATAYLRYQIGRDPPAVQQAIRATCTSPFADALLSQPVSIPPDRRNSLAAQPSALDSLTYTGPAALGQGPPAQIVVGRYHTVGHPDVRGTLTIEIVADGQGWRVTGLR